MARKVKGRCKCSEHEAIRQYGVKFCSNCKKILKYGDHPYPADTAKSSSGRRKIKRN